MSGTLHETTRLVGGRIVRRVSERAEWIVGDVDAGRVNVVLGARRAVLEIIFSDVLRHPRAFNKRRDRGVAVIPTEALPPVLRRIEPEQPARSSLVRELLALVELDNV